MKLKLNKKGFTLIELLTVMVILVTILLIAIPSITSSISRSESKQIKAKKDAIVADVNIKLMKSHFKDNTEYNKFKNGECYISVESLEKIGIITRTVATNKKGEIIEGCVQYDESLKQYKFIEKANCETGCDTIGK